MKDIENALNEEKLYLAEVKSNAVSRSLIERLADHGYKSLAEYFDDKKAYYLHQIDFKIYLHEPTDGIDARVWQAMRDEEACVWIPKLEFVLACVGKDEFDYDLAKELNVGVLNMPHAGGTIITGPDDLTIGIHFKSEHNLSYGYFFTKMKAFMESRGIVALDNDFMYDGKKVMGCSLNQTIDGMESFFFSCTFTDHIDLIKQLCSKKSVKIPGYIPAEVLTKQELLDEVLS